MTPRQASNCGNVWRNDIVENRELLQGASDTPAKILQVAQNWVHFHESESHDVGQSVASFLSRQLTIYSNFRCRQKAKHQTQRSLDLLGEKCTTLAATRRPSFPMMVMKMKMKTIEDDDEDDESDSGSDYIPERPDYQDYLLPCLLQQVKQGITLTSPIGTRE
jgi:hypothetical protein